MDSENSKVTDLGQRSNIEVINSLVELNSNTVIDAGCGDMTIAKMLAENGASVLAIDPDSVQADLNRKAEPIPNIEFVETGAENIPANDGSVDGVFFGYSLHHVPSDIYPKMFDEIVRVLKPGGFLYVIEPIACPANEIMKLFHDEDAVRAMAQTALREMAMPRFESVKQVTYHSFTQYESFDQYADRYASKSFNELYSEEDVRRPIVRETFERLGQPDYRFQVPKLVACLNGLKK